MFGLLKDRMTLAYGMFDVCSDSFTEEWIVHSYKAYIHGRPFDIFISNLCMFADVIKHLQILSNNLNVLQESFMFMEESIFKAIFESIDNTMNNLNCMFTKLAIQQITIRWFLMNHQDLSMYSNKIRKINRSTLLCLSFLATNYYNFFIKIETIANWIPSFAKERWRDHNILYTFNVNEWIMNERKSLRLLLKQMSSDCYYMHMKHIYVSHLYESLAPRIERAYGQAIMNEEIRLIFCIGIYDSLHKKQITLQQDIVDMILIYIHSI